MEFVLLGLFLPTQPGQFAFEEASASERFGTLTNAFERHLVTLSWSLSTSSNTDLLIQCVPLPASCPPFDPHNICLLVGAAMLPTPPNASRPGIEAADGRPQRPETVLRGPKDICGGWV